jgi:predicted RNase H-like HicB family nuclease/predicted RNA binding protein YcfA (HicA-like mRNA interferase family)
MKYTVVLERQPQGDYVVSVELLAGCVSQGDTREEALKHIQEAIELYVEDCRAMGDIVPQEGVGRIIEFENSDPTLPFPLNSPSPELGQTLERMGFVFRGRKGKHMMYRREQPYSRAVIMRGLDRETINEIWGSLDLEEQRRIEQQLVDRAAKFVRERYLDAQRDGQGRFEAIRQELIDGYVQKQARSATRNKRSELTVITRCEADSSDTSGTKTD